VEVNTNLSLDPGAAAEAIFEARRAQLEKSARDVIGEREYFTANQLETLTGTRPATWRWWASVNQGPESFLLGRRRVWVRSSVIQWLIEQEQGMSS
jgi:hypothetical protein